jgi:hypothetical protein
MHLLSHFSSETERINKDVLINVKSIVLKIKEKYSRKRSREGEEVYWKNKGNKNSEI